MIGMISLDFEYQAISEKEQVFAGAENKAKPPNKRVFIIPLDKSSLRARHTALANEWDWRHARSFISRR